jgi:cytochrome b subunit of formate dehydrogenase
MERILEAKLRKKTISTINAGLDFRGLMAGVTLILGIVLYQDFGLVSKDWTSCGNEYIPNETVFICLAVEIIINLLYVLWLKTEWRKMEPESPNEVILAQKFI